MHWSASRFSEWVVLAAESCHLVFALSKEQSNKMHLCDKTRQMIETFSTSDMVKNIKLDIMCYHKTPKPKYLVNF